MGWWTGARVGGLGAEGGGPVAGDVGGCGVLWGAKGEDGERVDGGWLCEGGCGRSLGLPACYVRFRLCTGEDCLRCIGLSAVVEVAKRTAQTGGLARARGLRLSSRARFGERQPQVRQHRGLARRRGGGGTDY